MQLYLNTYGSYLHIKDQMFEIRIKKEDKSWEKHYFSSKKVKSIIMSQGTALSYAAIKLAVTNNIDIIFVERDGQPIGRVWHSKLGSTSRIRKEQLIASLNNDGLSAVKKWITTKVDNEIDFLKKLKKHRMQHAEYFEDKIERMQAINISIAQLEAQNTAEVADVIRGLEGTSARLFVETLNYLLPQNYKFNGRSTRPAKDSFNAFLNYSFGILYSKIEKALIIAGLDPYLGYLHRDDYNQLSFVFDFIEPYRIYPTEIVFKLFSAKKVNNSHVEKITNGVSLNKKGKELLIETYNKFMEEDTIRYKGRNQTRNNSIQADAHIYANSIIKKNNQAENDNNFNKIVKL